MPHVVRVGTGEKGQRLHQCEFVVRKCIEDRAQPDVEARRIMHVLAAPYLRARRLHRLGVGAEVSIYPQRVEAESLIPHVRVENDYLAL